jgi:hypothetical protein
MATELPGKLERYFAAQNDHDVDAMAAAFASDAEVVDEHRSYVGREAIREWKRETSAKYGITVEPLSATDDGKIVSVVGRVAGNFPGSPADLTYDFALDDAGFIRSLKIH